MSRIPEAFELKDPGGICAAEQGVGVRVIHREVFDVDFRAMILRYELDRVVYYREVSQPQEVELYESRLFDIFHRILGNDFTFLTNVERHVFDNGLVGYHHPGGVRGSVARQPFEGKGDFEQLLYLRVFLLHFQQAGFDRS